MRKNVFILLVILISLLTGCGLETETFSELYNKNLGEVTEIVILDGTTGREKTIAEKAEVERFLEDVKHIKFIPNEDQTSVVGYRYRITLFKDQAKTFETDLREVNNHQYHTEPDMFPIVDDYFMNHGDDKE